MRVFVKSFASVITTGKITERTLELPVGATAVDAMIALGISSDDEMIVLINQRPLALESTLSENDKVVLMPPVSAA